MVHGRVNAFRMKLPVLRALKRVPHPLQMFTSQIKIAILLSYTHCHLLVLLAVFVFVLWGI